MANKTKNQKTKIYLAGLWIILAGFLLSTNPAKLSAALLVVPVLLLFVCLAGSIYFLQNVSVFGGGDRSAAKKFGLAVLLAAIPSFLLLLRSINQLTLKDLALLLILALVAWSYVKRFKFSQKIEWFKPLLSDIIMINGSFDCFRSISTTDACTRSRYSGRASKWVEWWR